MARRGEEFGFRISGLEVDWTRIRARKGVARARAVGETAGFIKVVADAHTDELLGMHVLAHIGADLLPQGILLLNTADRKMAPMTDCICVHPTFSEGVKAAATNLGPVDSVAR
jgi:pyruvate/2-oxoglutarate dehydrogenase complex dihydrolipoamide dehydrogenase (E3) component